MRSRLETTERSLKTSPGAIYDIDFLCSYLLVEADTREKGGTLRDRLWRCVDCGVLGKSDARKLDHAAELFRTVEHVTRMVLGRAQKWLPTNERARQATEELTTEILGHSFDHGIEAELHDNLRTVRAVYTRALGTPPE